MKDAFLEEHELMTGRTTLSSTEKFSSQLAIGLFSYLG